MNDAGAFCCVLSILAATFNTSLAEEKTETVDVLSRQVISTHGSNQGTAYTMSNRIITANQRIFVAWLDHVANCVIQSYDMENQTWSERTLLGKGTDNHCAPAITMDSEGYLYAMFGPHGAPFQFRRSKHPYDASSWGPVERFGSKGTYPSLVCGPDDTLHCAYRGGKSSPLQLIYHTRPKDGSWSEPRALVNPAVPGGYTQYTNALAVSPDGSIHLAFHIYDKHPPGGKSIGYLRSTDNGDTWESAEGRPIELPVTPASDCFVEQGNELDMRSSNVATDLKNNPWLIALHSESQPVSAKLWHHDGRSWIATELLPIIRSQYPGYVMAWMGTLTFDRTGCLYIATVIQQPPVSWGAASQEIVLLTSDDLGKTFEVQLISEPDPELPNWFPSIERPFGPEPIGTPSLIYCHSHPRDKETGICKPGEIIFARLRAP